MQTTQHQARKLTIAASTFAAWRDVIVSGAFERVEFWGELHGGRLVPQGLLADQAALDQIPVGICILANDGALVACNQAAIDAWGRRPALDGGEKFCGSHALRYPSGEPMPREHAPPSVAIRNGGIVRNADVIWEQPNGARRLASMDAFPIRSAQGEVIGAVNIFRHNPHKSVPGLEN